MVQNDQDDQDLIDGLAGMDAVPPVSKESSEAVMRLLAEHVPLTLLADLATPDGPVSQVILETEGLPRDAWWETEEGTEPVAQPGGDDAVVKPETAEG